MEKTGLRYIKGFDNYMVNREGGVYSLLTNRYLKSGDNGAGYRFVCLRSDGKTSNRYVHRLVSEAFLTGGGEEVNHIDGDKSNNSVTNLERVTSSENTRHGFRTGLMYTCPIQLTKDGVGHWYPTQKACADSLGVTASAVSGLAKGRLKSLLKYKLTN